MLIDWFTVGAQVLNFLILAWLLKRFLYRPVLDAIDAREKAVAATVADAAAREEKAQAEQAEFAKKNSDLDAQRGALFSEATIQARAERERLMGTVQAEAEALRAKCQLALEADYDQRRSDIARRARDEVLAIARKTLCELADVALEQKTCDMFVQRLRALNGGARTTMIEAVRAAGGSAMCRSAYAFSAQQQTALSAALDEVCSGRVALVFQTAPELVSGVELNAQGYKLAWNIDDYLAAFGASIGKAVHERAQAGPTEPPGAHVSSGAVTLTGAQPDEKIPAGRAASAAPARAS